MRHSFNKGYLLREFERIDAELRRKLQIYLIGGGAMALAGMKEATKDVDIIVSEAKDAELLFEILNDLGYRKVLEPGKEYVNIGASFILENAEAFRWDIFVAQVMGNFIFSESMKRRSTILGAYRNLKVSVASSSDIFLFKSITDREGDVEDMNILVRAGIDSEALLQEVGVQRKLLGTEMWITYLSSKLVGLEEKYGVSLPVKVKIEKMARKVYDKLEVTLLLKDRDWSLKELEERAEMNRTELEDVIRDLLTRELIKKVKGKFRLISEKL